MDNINEIEYLIPVYCCERRILRVTASSLEDAILNVKAEYKPDGIGLVRDSFYVNEEEAIELNKDF